jgi:hypothetical protein
VLGYNAPEDRLLPENYDWTDRSELDAALATVIDALRPWMIDMHVAQNDGTVFGSGTHDKTGRHCLPGDPNGKLDVTAVAGMWLRGPGGEPTRAVQHLCWDGCMFPNVVMNKPQMLAVRDAHGWA